MATKHPRINTALERPLYEAIARLARADGVSLSQKVRDLVRDALEQFEDAGLEGIVRRRRRMPGRWVSHAELKRRLRIP